MQYRPFGKDGWKISVLGFGAMRFPLTPNNTVDVPRAIDLIRCGIDNGINYVDTAYIYHDGTSEEIVGKALKDGYREKVRVATKSPGHLISGAADFDRILDEQLKRLDLEFIDYYMFHGIGQKSLTQITELGLFERMENAKAKGKIGHIGFSFHDDITGFKAIVDAYSQWEFCQIQYNYMDIENQAGTEGLRYAAQKDIPIIIMEPLLGGRLANPPQDIQKIVKQFEVSRRPADWALSWIWNHPEVATVLSGMNDITQLEENCSIATKATPGHLKTSETQFVEILRGLFSKRAIIPCTRCDYCKPCPAGIDIGWNLELYNDAEIYDNLSTPRFVYNNFVPKGQRAQDCTGCKECEQKCPQKIEISAWMPKVAKLLQHP